MEYLIRNNKLAVHQSGNRKLHWTEKQLCCTLRISYSRLWIARKSPSWSYQICLKHLTVFNTISCYPSYKISTFPKVRQIGFKVTFLTDNSAFELVMQFLKCFHRSIENEDPKTKTRRAKTYKNEELRKRSPPTKTKTLYENEDPLRKRRPPTKTKTSYENEDPFNFCWKRNNFNIT